VLAHRLTELGHCVSVTNYGQLRHNSMQDAINLRELLKFGERIDIAVFYDGINEMACAEQTGRADRLFNEARRHAEFNILHSERRQDLIAAALMAVGPRTLRRVRQWTGLPLRRAFPVLEADLSHVDLDGSPVRLLEHTLQTSAWSGYWLTDIGSSRYFSGSW
jgi:hypothetical protein